MNTRKIIIRVAVVAIGLPLVVGLIAVGSFYAYFYSPNRANGTIVSSGQEREYLLYVPTSYDRTKPTPLVISLHAAAMWPAAQAEIGQWNRLAEQQGSIVGKVWASPRPFPSVLTWTADWARRNRCGPDPIESAVPADVTRLEYARCADDSAVVLYTIRGGGHAWPGGKPLPEWIVGPTTRSIDATSQMWAFFSGHHLLAN